MTRPIFEPNTGRAIASADFATQQLFRRPAPQMASVDTDWAVANGDTDEIVSDDTAHNIPYDSVDIPTDSTCFQVGVSNIRPISIIKNGWYQIYIEAWPETIGSAGNYTVGLAFSGSGFMYNAGYVAGSLYSRQSTYYRQGSIQIGFQPSFGPFYAQTKHDVGGDVRVGGFVHQALDTPGTMDWNYGKLAIVYLGPGLDLPDTSHWAPDGEDHDEVFRTYF